jgi:phosphomannomutase
MGAKVSEVGDSQEFVVAFEEAIGALNTTINRDKDSFASSALALEIYANYQQQNLDFVDILEKEIYPKYGY